MPPWRKAAWRAPGTAHTGAGGAGRSRAARAARLWAAAHESGRSLWSGRPGPPRRARRAYAAVRRALAPPPAESGANGQRCSLWERHVAPACHDGKRLLQTTPPPPLQTFRRLLGWLRPYRKALAISIVLAVGSQGAALVIPALVGKVIDDALRAGDRHELYVLVGLIVAGGRRQRPCSWSRGGCWRAASRWTSSTTCAVAYYTHLQRLSLRVLRPQPDRAADVARDVRRQRGAHVPRLRADLHHPVRGHDRGRLVLLLLWTSVPLALVTFVLMPADRLHRPTRYSRRSHPCCKRRPAAHRRRHHAGRGERSSACGWSRPSRRRTRETERFPARAERVFERELDAARLRAIYTPLLGFLPAARPSP